MEKIADILLNLVDKHLAWIYLLAIPVFVIFLLVIACSKYGNLKLGGKNDKPEYSAISWFAMLFCGATGIGLVFYSLAEPMSHYVNPDRGIEPMSKASASFAIRTVFLEWGLVQFSCFTIIGLAMAYFVFRKNGKYTFSSMLKPLLGKSMDGKAGATLDWYSIVVSICGVATSLGLGCIQIVGGLNYMYNVPEGNGTYIVIIGIVTIVFTLSAVSGINKGIKFLSNLNTVFAVVLLILGFCMSNKDEVMLTMTNGIGQHLQYFFVDCLGIDPYGDYEWMMNWKVFYWAWYIAWTPFVGMFMARISKGRTIREFIAGCVIAPSVFTIIWFSVFGTIAIDFSHGKSATLIADMAANPQTAVFKVFKTLPAGAIMSILVIALLAIFFITSADSATYSISLLSNKGETTTPIRKIVIAVIEGGLALLLLCTGGLKALQTISIVAALPFTIVMFLVMASFVKELKKEKI